MAIRTMMSGKELDRTLKAINDIQTTENNGLLLWVQDGELAAEDGELLFDVLEVE